MKRSVVSQTLMLVLTFVVGVLIVAQIRTQSRTRTLAFDANEESLFLSELVDANRNLRNEIASLQEQLASYDQVTRRTVLEELVEEMNRVKVANGASEVWGPGVELVIDGALTVLDLQDLLNELRNAGAEAIALNDQRLVSYSVLALDRTGQLTADGYPVRRPYRLQAIGDPDTLETAMLRPGGAADILQRTYPSLVLQSKQRSKLVLSVHRSLIQFAHARPIE